MTTFDKVRLSVQSICLYTLVENLNVTESLPAFTVNSKFQRRGGRTKVSYPEYIQLLVYGYDIIIDIGRVVRVSVFIYYYDYYIEQNDFLYVMKIRFRLLKLSSRMLL